MKLLIADPFPTIDDEVRAISSPWFRYPAAA